jgi:hypothetical protein
MKGKPEHPHFKANGANFKAIGFKGMKSQIRDLI